MGSLLSTFSEQRKIKMKKKKALVIVIKRGSMVTTISLVVLQLRKTAVENDPDAHARLLVSSVQMILSQHTTFLQH